MSADALGTLPSNAGARNGRASIDQIGGVQNKLREKVINVAFIVVIVALFSHSMLREFFGISLIIYALLVVTTLFMALGHYENINQKKRIQTDGFTLITILAAFARSNLETENSMDLFQVADIVKREKDLLYCIITDKNGKPFVHLGSNPRVMYGSEQIVCNALASDSPLTQVYEDPSNRNAVYEFSKPGFPQSRSETRKNPT